MNNYDQSYTLTIQTLSGALEEYNYNNKYNLLYDYNKYLVDLRQKRFDMPDDEVYIFKTENANMVAYKNVFGEIEYVTTDLFYRRHYVNKSLVKKVKSITGE